MAETGASDAQAATQADSLEQRRAAARRRRRVRLSITLTVTALLLFGGYTAACALTPLPDLRAELAVSAEQEYPADDAALEAAVEDQSLPTAAGWAHLDEVWANDDAPREIASLTKLVTALVCLDAKPVEAGSDGPTYTVRAEDAAIRERVLTENGSASDTPEGAKLTTRQMLELILLPSANNYAIAYADWTFGGEQEFADAAMEWADRHGLESVVIVEPSGLSPENVASPADLVRIARLVLEQPLLAEIVAEPWADIPEIGPVENSNPLLGETGVVGLKTGTTTTAGYSLAAARRASPDGRDLVALSVVLGRDDDSERAADARTVLDAADAAVQGVEVVPEDEEVGRVTTWSGERVALRAAGEVMETLTPGETATRTVRVGAIDEGDRGGTVGAIGVDGAERAQQVPVVTAAAIPEPDLWWRLGHPAIVFGWQDPAPR